MKTRSLSVLALASFLLCAHSFAASPFASSVVSYDPGVGFVPGFVHPDASLGEPSRVNPFGEPTDPFDPPYGTNQIVSIGAGGSLVVRFPTPILNQTHAPSAIDFLIFGNTGFIITNEFDFNTYDWIGLPATDGSLFAQNTGVTRVSVSRDGERFFTLDPSFAPGVDQFPPTDGAGDFRLPLDPSLAPADFAGATLDDIRSLYQGSAGGAGFDISWARDAAGRRVFLPVIRFVRIEVISGKIEVDGFAAALRRVSSCRHPRP